MNIPEKSQPIKTSLPIIGGQKLTQTTVSAGNNNSIRESGPKIVGGDGTKHNPYILDGNDYDDDIAYLQLLANKHQENFYFMNGDTRYRVTPE